MADSSGEIRVGAFTRSAGDGGAHFATPLLETFVAFQMARTIMAAGRLGVFEALEQGPGTADGLAERLSLDPHGLDLLLNALASQEYVSYDENGRYRNTEVVRRFLLPGSPETVGHYALDFGYDLWEVFSGLEDGIQTGRQAAFHDHAPDDPFWDRYIQGLADLARIGADAVVGLLPLDRPTRMLELGGGHGVYSSALCRVHSGLAATVIDLPGSARVGRRMVDEYGMADRISYEVGDVLTAAFGEGYDLVTAFRLVHFLDPAQAVDLFRRVRKALRPGGTFAVLDVEPTAPERPRQVEALGAIFFYLTSGARAYQGEEVASLMAEAGFVGTRLCHHPDLDGSVLVLGAAG